MTVVVKSDLESSNNNLEQVFDLSSNMFSNNTDILNFISESQNVLKGGGYDALRDVLSYYCELFEYASKLCISIYENFTIKNQNMINYMSSLDEIDDSILTDLENILLRCKQNLFDAYEALKNNIHTSIDLSKTQEKVDFYEFLVEKVKNLSNKDNNLSNNLEGVKSMVENFKNYVDNIKVIEVNEFNG